MNCCKSSGDVGVIAALVGSVCRGARDRPGCVRQRCKECRSASVPAINDDSANSLRLLGCLGGCMSYKRCCDGCTPSPLLAAVGMGRGVPYITVVKKARTTATATGGKSRT